MAKADRLKEEIGWLKLVFGLLVAIGVSVLGWLAQHYGDAEIFIALAAVAVAAAGFGVTIGVAWIIYRRLGELEET